MPLNRNETLQEGLGIPLPASTQWDIVADQAERAEPVFEELVRQAAQGDVLYNDDTTVKILAMMDRQALTEDLVDEPVEDSTEDGSVEDSAEMAGDAAEAERLLAGYPLAGRSRRQRSPKPSRKGMFTTGIVAEIGGGEKIALFLSGHQHAGENLKDVLIRRATDLPPPIQMCDALSRYLPRGLKTIQGNCLPCTGDGNSSTWRNGFPRSAATCWSRSQWSITTTCSPTNGIFLACGAVAFASG